MTPDCLVAIGASVVGAFFLGLWIGERGRRKATEAWLVNGTTEYGPARGAQPRHPRPSDIPSPPSAPANFSDDTLQKGAEILIAEAKGAGMPVPSLKEARAQAAELLRMGELVERDSDELAVPLPTS